jgi:hypothetical protein
MDMEWVVNYNEQARVFELRDKETNDIHEARVTPGGMAAELMDRGVNEHEAISLVFAAAQAAGLPT